MTDNVQISREEGVLILTLDRPAKKNAFTSAAFAGRRAPNFTKPA